MPQQAHIIDGVLEIAARVAEGRGSSKEDIALGIIAALRRIHAVVGEACEGLALSLRMQISDLIVAHNLERLRQTGSVPAAAPLPEPALASARVAVAVFDDAANSALALNALTPSNAGIELAVRGLVQRLLGVLGGAPDYRLLVDRIASDEAAPPTLLPVPHGHRPSIN
jgi:hypothetical protein